MDRMHTPIAYRVFDLKLLIEVVYSSGAMASKHAVLGVVSRNVLY